MRDSKSLWVAAGALVVWLILAWFMAGWLGLEGSDAWILRAGLAIIGIAGFAAYYWLQLRNAGQAGGAAAGDGSGASELGVLFSEADARLQNAGLGRSVKIANLPNLLLAGDSGSGKTSILVQCGLEAELLSGHVFGENAVVPTRALNIWYARSTVFVDVGGPCWNDPASRVRLLKKLAPAKLSSVLGGSGQAPRAVLFCIECDIFLKPGAAESLAARARHFNAWLGEVSQQLGIRLPVYVLFTKMDRAPNFLEFFGNLTAEETAQVCGVTLPMHADSQSGIYAERETKRLSEAFQDLYRSMCDRRPDFLGREHDAAKLPSIYEYPRDFRKLRSLMVQFLVDLCRPSQIRTSPFLRGFYFTGVRPFLVRDVAQEPAAPAAHPAPFDAEATRMLNIQEVMAPQPYLAEAQAGGGRRIAQWVFLSHLFSEVILKDRPASSSSSVSVRVNFLRRLLLATGAVAALVVAIGWTVSWAGNRSLAREALEAAEKPAADPVQGELASQQALEVLESQRQALVTLIEHQRYGAPMGLRWGLYTGDALYPAASRKYFGTFRRLLLAPTQSRLADFLSRPESAQPAGYRPVYDALKAYLITTSHHDKSTRAFLVPVLMQHWQSARAADVPRAALARRQFEFYAGELQLRNPYPHLVTPDANTVSRARGFLSQFAATEAIYSAMLTAAGAASPTFIFNQSNPGSAEVVVNTYPMPGGFTKAGWTFMQNAIRQPEDYFKGETWVLGPQSLGNIDRAKLQEELRVRYRTEFVQRWREFLKNTSVVRFASIPDAAGKLTRLSGNQSPLLAVLCAVSQNTAVDDKAVASLFQPPQHVLPAGCQDRLASPTNEAYMGGLIRLQADLQQLSSDMQNDILRTGATTSATSAQIAVRNLARDFQIDKEAPPDAKIDTKTQGLLEDPIRYVQAIILGGPRDAINAGGGPMCTQLRALAAKYPFQPKATVQATLADIDAVFKPVEGALWRFYSGGLSKILIKQGNSYVPNPGGGPSVNPQFAAFFNSAAALSEALYRGGSQKVNLAFSLRPAVSENVQGISLGIHGRTLSWSGGRAAPQQFTWPGESNQDVRLRVRFSGGSEFDVFSQSGLWAVFRLFIEAENWQTAGSEHTMEWTPRTTAGPMTVGGRQATVRLVLDMGGAPPFFRPGWLAGLGCIAAAAR